MVPPGRSTRGSAHLARRRCEEDKGQPATKSLCRPNAEGRKTNSEVERKYLDGTRKTQKDSTPDQSCRDIKRDKNLKSKIFNQEQSHFLEELFSANQHPSLKERRAIAEKLNLYVSSS